MSAWIHTKVVVVCNACARVTSVETSSVADCRRSIKRDGWTRRANLDTYVDLCPKCGPTFVPPPGTFKSPGRPRRRHHDT